MTGEPLNDSPVVVSVEGHPAGPWPEALARLSEFIVAMEEHAWLRTRIDITVTIRGATDAE
ncbi:MAG TPA: hypothetical protein VIX41_11500 [Acidimicrobiales bacterium]